MRSDLRSKLPFALECESARELSLQTGSKLPSSKTRMLTEKHGGPDSLVMPRSSMRLEVDTTRMHTCNTTHTNDDKSALNMRYYHTGIIKTVGANLTTNIPKIFELIA